MALPALLLTGGPAAGKSTTALALASTTDRTSFIDVDDVRQLVKNGGAAPWDGREGTAQQILGVLNAAAMTNNFLDARFNVTIADVVNPTTLGLYRRLVPNLLVVRLSLTLAQARRRAVQRTVYLTDDEFDELHRQQTEPLEVDVDVDVGELDRDDQVSIVRDVWTARDC